MTFISLYRDRQVLTQSNELNKLGKLFPSLDSMDTKIGVVCSYVTLFCTWCCEMARVCESYGRKCGQVAGVMSTDT